MNTIIIDKDIRKALSAFLTTRNYSKIVVIADENTSKNCYLRFGFQDLLPEHYLIEIRSGEEEKNLRTCEHIWLKMTEYELDRKSLVINLGGGVIGDMGGFCASTYKRGIDFIQIPTTLLSMVDASVGGKLGIDFHNYKNHIGVFKVPEAVLISTPFLETLPLDELRSGFGEVIKHCLIADSLKWQQLINSNWRELDHEDLVRHSINIKDRITAEDPSEKGIRKILNYGHTLGHAIESFYLNTKHKLLHGEAIAVGMACEAFIAHKRNLLDKIELHNVVSYLLKTYGHVAIPDIDIPFIIKLTKQDKKNEFDQVQFALIGPIGTCSYGIAVTDEEMKDALTYYINLDSLISL